MAFPFSPLIDDFNRADAAIPGSTSSSGVVWNSSTASIVGLASGSLKILSNQAGPSSVVNSSSWIDATLYGPDVEAYADIAALGASDTISVWVRLTSPGGSVNGYVLKAIQTTNAVELYRYDSGAATLISSSISQTITAGDSVGLSVSGSTFTIYYKVGAGAWTVIGTASDATYSAAGAIGLGVLRTAGRADNFGGGTIVPAPVPLHPLQPQLQRFAPLWLPLLGRLPVPQPLFPAITPDTGINATSAVTATVTALHAVKPAAINATSAVTATVVAVRAVKPAAINATSSVSATVGAVRRITPAAINATSAVTATVSRLRTISPSAINATSTLTASLVSRRAITPAAINATSSVTASVKGPVRFTGVAISATSSIGLITLPSSVHASYSALPPRLLVEINFPKDVGRFSTREAVQADNPHFHHELNETSGTTALDSSGNGRNASYVAAPTFAQDSPISGQRGVDPNIPPSYSSKYASTSQYVEQTAGPAAPSALTLSLLVKPTAFPTGGNKFDVVKNTGYGRISILSSGQVEVDLGTVFQSGAANLLTLNQWTRIAVTVSGQGNNQKHTLYLDGNPVANAVGASQLAAMGATYRFGASGSTAATAFAGQITSIAAFLAELDRLRHQQHVVGNPVDVTPPDIWSDVGQYVRTLAWKRGRAQRLDRIEGGTLTLELDNSDRRFEPGYQGTITALNYLENPSFETGILGWSASNGTISRWTTHALQGSWSGKFTAVGSGDMTIYGLRADGTSLSGIVPGQNYTFQTGFAWLNNAGGSRVLDYYLEWRDVSDAVLSTSSLGSSTIPNGGGSIPAYGSVTAPANAVKARLKVIARSMLANEVISLDAALFGDVDPSTNANVYLDGDAIGNFWEGSTQASRTVRSSVYYPFLRPMRRVRVRAIYPGNNLLRDSSFEREALGAIPANVSYLHDVPSRLSGSAWLSELHYAGTPATAAVVSSGAFNGTKAVKFTVAAVSDYAEIVAGSSNLTALQTQALTVSCYAKRDSGNPARPSLAVRWLDAWNNFVAYSEQPLVASDITTSWVRYSITFTPPAGAVRAQVIFNSNYTTMAAVPAAVYVDAIQAEYGSAASAYNDSLLYDLYNGYITAWPQSYLSHRRSTVTVSCIDGFAGLATALLTTKFSAELSGTRLAHILDQAGWPTSERSLDAGANTVMTSDFTTAAGATPTRVDALSHAQDVSDSELGIFFLDGRGYTVFHDGNHRTTQTRSTTSQATFGDGAPSGSELPYLPGIQPDYDVARVYNEIRITRQSASSGDNPVEQVASDGLSQADNFRRTMQRTTLLSTDAACLAQAQALLARYKDPKLETRTISLEPARDSRLWPVVLSTLISDRVTLVRRPQGLPPPLQNDYFIESLEHQIVLGLGGTPSSWKVGYATSLAS